jgi:hypothetical protein
MFIYSCINKRIPGSILTAVSNIENSDRAMVQEVNLSPLWPGFAPRSLHVGFVVDKVALGQVFLRVLRLSRVNIIPPWLSILIYHQRINNRPVGGCSSET